MPGFFTWKPRRLRRATSADARAKELNGNGVAHNLANGHVTVVDNKNVEGTKDPTTTLIGQKIAERVELLSRLNQVWEDQHRSAHVKRSDITRSPKQSERPHVRVRFREEAQIDGILQLYFSIFAVLGAKYDCLFRGQNHKMCVSPFFQAHFVSRSFVRFERIGLYLIYEKCYTVKKANAAVVVGQTKSPRKFVLVYKI